MTTAAIIGAGDLGGAVAQALASRESVNRVVLVDAAAPVAAGKALDIQQSGAISGVHVTLQGTADPARLIGCDVCVVADRAGHPVSEWQGEEGLAYLVSLAPFIGPAAIVFAGTQQAGLMRACAREAGFRPERLIGSSPEALGSAIRAIVAMEARCAPAEVMLSVLGAPPAGFSVPWSEASIGGYALQQVLSPVQVARIEARTTRLWPPQAYALGLAAAVVVEAVLRSARRAVTVLTLLDGEFGVRGQIGALPALLSTTGIVHRRVPSLSTRERILVETAVAGGE